MNLSYDNKYRERYFSDDHYNIFPYRFNDNIIIYFDDYYAYDIDARKHIIDVHDNEGYKYRLPYIRIIQSSRKNTVLRRFFQKSYFTLYNINNFLKLNDIPLILETLNGTDSARTKLNFISENGENIICSWNDIQSNIKSYNRENIKCIIEYQAKKKLTKSDIENLIIKKSKELNRPLLQSDFENVHTTNNTVGIRIIYKYWGTFSNMIKELGLEEHGVFFKPNSKFYKPHSYYLEYIKNICEDFKSHNIVTLMIKDFKKMDSTVEISTLKRHCLLENTTLQDMLHKYGCKLQTSGNGFYHMFEDGECTLSRYEYDFSETLRKYGFKYNKNYYRDVRYDEILNTYSGNMNCDYKIICNIDAFKNNIKLNSKSKELYRIKLNKKKDIFEKAHVNYLILFKPDMSIENFEKIISSLLSTTQSYCKNHDDDVIDRMLGFIK
jgi:hypothetical protein